MENNIERIENLIKQMTCLEKVRLCHAVSKFSSGGVERLEIPALTMSDGPHGVREEYCADSWLPVGGDDDYATYLPTGTALAATWNPQCAKEFGEVLGSESRDRKKDVILGPGVNIIRSPLCGRNFEYYSEDPYLSGMLGASVVKGIQSQGTMACVKHFALNNQELNRHGVDARCDERTLREIYLPAFEKTVKDGGAASIMGSYNRFRGQYCCQNDYLLNQILKKEWGFDGVVISDWGGVNNTCEAAKFGMDIEMGTNKPYDQYYLGSDFQKAVENGEIEEEILNDKVRRILRVMFRFHIIGDTSKRPKGSRNTLEHQTKALKIALEAITLLKNQGNILPLQPNKIKKLLVVGDNALRKHHWGGQSSGVKALYEVPPLEGIKNYLRDYPVEVEYIKGYPTEASTIQIPTEFLDISDHKAGTRGWSCEIYDNRNCSGAPVAVIPLVNAAFDPNCDLPESIKTNDFGILLKGTVTPQKTETWEFYLNGASQAELWTDNGNGRRETWWDGGTMLIATSKGPDDICASAKYVMETGKHYALTVRINLFPETPLYPVSLRIKLGESADLIVENNKLDEAAKKADAILFFGGLNHTFDVEGTDRDDMALHDGQNELISHLAKLNQNFVVVLAGGSAMEMPWVDEVRSIVLMWYSGMECGNAIAKILFGEVCPSGKLPFTFPEKLADSPAHALSDYNKTICNYAEGVLVGYRWFDAKQIKPLFCFGHGLSYTTFFYSDVNIQKKDDKIIVSVTVKNTGTTAGAEVVQLYVAPPKCQYVRPQQELKGFQKCFLKSGEMKKVSFELDFRSFAFYNPNYGCWETSQGEYQIKIGSSSRDIRVKNSLFVHDVFKKERI